MFSSVRPHTRARHRRQRGTNDDTHFITIFPNFCIVIIIWLRPFFIWRFFFHHISIHFIVKLEQMISENLLFEIHIDVHSTVLFSHEIWCETKKMREKQKNKNQFVSRFQSFYADFNHKSPRTITFKKIQKAFHW